MRPENPNYPLELINGAAIAGLDIVQDEVDLVEVAVAGKQAGIQLKDETISLGAPGTFDTIDFAGAGVTATRVGNAVTVAISGATPASYIHTQAVAASEWIINHNLGYKPNIEVRTIGNVVMDAEVLHFSDNQARVYFSQLLTGNARCV